MRSMTTSFSTTRKPARRNGVSFGNAPINREL